MPLRSESKIGLGVTFSLVFKKLSTLLIRDGNGKLPASLPAAVAALACKTTQTEIKDFLSAAKLQGFTLATAEATKPLLSWGAVVLSETLTSYLNALDGREPAADAAPAPVRLSPCCQTPSCRALPPQLE